MPIKLTFQPGGKVRVEPVGYAGQTCHAATKPYEDALVGRKTVEELTVDETERVTQFTPQTQSQ